MDLGRMSESGSVKLGCGILGSIYVVYDMRVNGSSVNGYKDQERERVYSLSSLRA